MASNAAPGPKCAIARSLRSPSSVWTIFSANAIEGRSRVAQSDYARGARDVGNEVDSRFLGQDRISCVKADARFVVRRSPQPYPGQIPYRIAMGVIVTRFLPWKKIRYGLVLSARRPLNLTVGRALWPCGYIAPAQHRAAVVLDKHQLAIEHHHYLIVVVVPVALAGPDTWRKPDHIDPEVA